MIYELRVYRVVQGRMADLLTRFEHQTVPIMVRHGFVQAGFWTTIVGRSEQLTYLLAWESLAQRQEQWAAFESDAEWLAIRKSTEENGEEAAFYSERERAALALTEAVTRITEGHVPDAVFERARAHFNEQELIALVFTLTTINAWNRLAITMRTEVGNYQPKARPVSQPAQN
jgi:short subunit dehydrogenase-like uncharacterized protein